MDTRNDSLIRIEQKVIMISQYLKQEELQVLFIKSMVTILFTKSMVDATHTYTPKSMCLSMYSKNLVRTSLDIHLTESPTEVIIFYS